MFNWIKDLCRTNITKHLEREIHTTTMSLLKAEDELSEAQYRVKAFQSRITRLQGRLRKIENDSGDAPPIEIRLGAMPINPTDVGPVSTWRRASSGSKQ